MVDEITPFEALERAAAIAGTQAALARIAECSTTAVWKWFQVRRCGVEYVLKVEAGTGVSRHLLRPDIFGASQSQLPDNVEPDLDCSPLMSRRSTARQSNRKAVLDGRNAA